MQRQLVDEFCDRFVTAALTEWKPYAIQDHVGTVTRGGACEDRPCWLITCWGFVVTTEGRRKIRSLGCRACSATIRANRRTSPIMLAFRLAPSIADARWDAALSASPTLPRSWMFTSDVLDTEVCLVCGCALLSHTMARGIYCCDRMPCVLRIWELVRVPYVVWAIRHHPSLVPDIKPLIIDCVVTRGL